MPVHPARPTTYAGIDMRSRTEARYAHWLDQHGIGWEYEPRAFAANGFRQYLPDFRLPAVSLAGGGTAEVFVDVKGDVVLGVQFETLIRMKVIWQSRPDAILLIETSNDAAEMLGAMPNMDLPSDSGHVFAWTCAEPAADDLQLGIATSRFGNLNDWS